MPIRNYFQKKAMQNRRNMERKIYEEIKGDDEKVKEHIEQRVELSNQKYLENKRLAEEKHEMLKKGREYVLKNDVVLFHGVPRNPRLVLSTQDNKLSVGTENKSFTISAGAVLQTDRETNRSFYKVAYCICSPKDTYSRKVARGYIGDRLKKEVSENNLFAFRIRMTKPGALKPKHIIRLAEEHIHMDLLSGRAPCSRKLYSFFYNNRPTFVMEEGLAENEKTEPDNPRKNPPSNKR